MRCGTGNGTPGVFVPFALAAGFSLLSTATMASGPEIREFRDWRAGCDNVGHCTALSLPDDEDNAIAYLRLDRAAGADAPVRLVLRVLGDWKTVSVPLRLKLDGAAFPATAEAAQVGADSGTISLTFQPAEASAFVAAARKATQLSISTPDMTAHVSLSGSVAAMLWIDEQQGRLDTPSALICKGSGSHVPAALALPVITAKVPDGVLADDAGKALAEAVRQEMLRRDLICARTRRRLPPSTRRGCSMVHAALSAWHVHVAPTMSPRASGRWRAAMPRRHNPPSSPPAQGR